MTKTAVPAFTRTYNWSITKDVDKTLVEQIGGSGDVQLHRERRPETGFTDSGWAASGQITVSNPNDWEPITADLTDAIDNGGTCSITGGTTVIDRGG